MKKLYKLFSMVALSVATFTSCEYEPLIYDVDNGPVMAQFKGSSASLPTPQEGASKTIEVQVTTKSSSARSIDVSVDESSTATPEMYTIGNLEIPANSYVGTIEVTANFDALPEEGSVMLKLNLDGIAGAGVQIDKGSYSIEMLRKCPTVVSKTYAAEVFAFDDQAPGLTVEMVAVEGEDFTWTIESAWGPTFVSWATGDSGYDNLYLYSATVKLNEADGSVEVIGDDAWATGGEGSYNACDDVFTFTLTQGLFTTPFTVDVVMTGM